MADLWEAYGRVSLEEPCTLDRFVDRALGGEFGAVAKEEMVDFLHRMEATIYANIEAMAETNPHLAPLADDRRQETSEQVARLVERVLGGSGGT